MPRASIQWSTVSTRQAEDGDEVQTTIGEIVFDAVTAQTRDLLVELPEHPVEGGAASTDHAIPQPRRVTFEAHVSSATFDLETSSGASRRTADGIRVIGSSAPTDRAADVLAVLQDLVDHGTEVDILGLPHGDLEGYQIASVSIAQDQTTGAQLVPVIEARQRITASVSEVDAPAPRVERTRPRRDRGTQPANEEAPSRTQTRSSLVTLGVASGLLGSNP